MTSKTLADDSGDTLHIYPWRSGRVSLIARQGSKRAEFGPFDPADLIAAIREVAGETDEPATPTVPTAEDFAKAEFARHEDGRFAARFSILTPAWLVRMHGGPLVWRSDADMAEEGWQIVTPAPTTARELLAMLPDLCYEPEGDVIPADTGHVIVWDDGDIAVASGGYPYAPPAVIGGGRRLLLDPPAPATPAWHNARIVEATAGGSDRVEWARTEDGYWVSLGGIARTVASSALSDVTVVVPKETDR